MRKSKADKYLCRKKFKKKLEDQKRGDSLYQ